MPEIQPSWNRSSIREALVDLLGPAEVLDVVQSTSSPPEPVIEVKTPASAEIAVSALVGVGRPFRVQVSAAEQSRSSIEVVLYGWPLSAVGHDVWSTGLAATPSSGIAWCFNPHGPAPRKRPAPSVRRQREDPNI